MIDEKNFMKFMNALEEAGAENVSFDNLKRFIEEQPKIGEWIPCSDRLPEEHESAFAKFKGTGRWDSGMYEKTSGLVIVTIEDKSGNRATTTACTVDGKWRIPGCFHSDVVAWMPFPEVYHG